MNIHTTVFAPEATIERINAYELLARIKACSVDLIVSSPPYFIGKEYDRSDCIEDFVADHEKLVPLLTRALKPGGSLCWQIGHHVRNGLVTPLDALVYPIFSSEPKLMLRNRIIWTFGHGVHAKRRFSGRHETLLWFTKGDDYYFDLDSVRVPQKYPGKKHYKGNRRGEFSGNPLGKNPSDVWDIPNVKAGHVEKTEHPCQFPVALVQRLIRSLCPPQGLVFDPFMGSGTAGVAAIIEKRNFVGSEIKAKYISIAKRRFAEAMSGVPKVRSDKSVFVPTGREAVSVRPSHFMVHE